MRPEGPFSAYVLICESFCKGFLVLRENGDPYSFKKGMLSEQNQFALAREGKMKELRELYSSLPQRASAPFLKPRRLEKAKPVHWRFADHPRTGTIYDLPDDLTLQRGITYTFLPDGQAIRVPAMNRLNVRAEAEGHQEDEDEDIVQALQQILTGKRASKNKPGFDAVGRARRPASRRIDDRGPMRKPDAHGQGLRPMEVQQA